jgi:hypothetical protein
VHKWIDDPQICQVESRQALQNDPRPGMMAAFLVTNHWLSLWDGIVVSYVQYERPLVDKVTFARILATISSLIFRVNWASLRPMRSSNHAPNGTQDAINGLCGGENPLCVTMAPWALRYWRKGSASVKSLASSNPFPQHSASESDSCRLRHPRSFSPCAYLICSRPGFSLRKIRVRT